MISIANCFNIFIIYNFATKVFSPLCSIRQKLVSPVFVNLSISTEAFLLRLLTESELEEVAFDKWGYL